MFDWLKRLWRGSNGSAIARRRKTIDQLPVGITFMYTGSEAVPSLTFVGRDLDQLIEQATYSYACITANSEAAASLDWQVERKDGEGSWVRDTEHELNALLRQPLGPGSSLGMKGFIEVLALQRYIAGNSYLRPVTNRSTRMDGRAAGSKLMRFDLFHPADISTDEENYKPTLYRYRPKDGPPEDFEPGQLVHIMNASANRQDKGPAPLRAAEDPVTIDASARTRQKGMMENRIGAGVIVKIPGIKGRSGARGRSGPAEAASAVTTYTKRAELEERLIESYGQAEKAGRPWVLDPDMSVERLPTSDEYLQLIDTRKMAREEICAIFRTPPPIVGIMEQATLNNMETLERLWWQLALFPVLTDISQALNAQAIQPIYGEGVRLHYTLRGSQVALLFLQKKLEVGLQMVKMGYPPGVANRVLEIGMPHIVELENPLIGLVLAGRMAVEDLGGEFGGDRRDGAEMEGSLNGLQ